MEYKQLFSFENQVKLQKWAMLNFLRQKQNLYLLVDMPGNLGDHLIWAGTRQMLDDEDLQYSEISVHKINETGKTKGSLIVPGSGAFHKYWHEWKPALIISASKIFDEVIVMPSGFDESIPIVMQAINMKNVYAFARDAFSYAHMKKKVRIGLAFDCALYYNFPKGKSRNQQLVALRSDEGSLLLKEGYVLSEMNNDVSLSQPDLQHWVKIISEADSVVTDWLHVAVAAFMTNTELYYIDPYDEKISRYFQYIFGNQLPKSIHRIDLDWLSNRQFIVRGVEHEQ